MLILLQLFKIATLSVWHLTLNKKNVGYFSHLLSNESSAYIDKEKQDLHKNRQSEIEERMKEHAKFKSLYLGATMVKN